MASNPHAAQFTPGPWFQDEQNPLHIVDAQGTLIASTQLRPNAHLVATAPELYEVLTELLNIAEVFQNRKSIYLAESTQGSR